MSESKWRWSGLPLQTEQLSGTSCRRYIVRLLRGVAYYSSTLGAAVYVRLGWVTDLTSLPEVLPLRKEGAWTPAAVVHDYLYATGEVAGRPISRRVADRVFLEAMASLGVGWRSRQIRYWGSRVGGWRAWRRSRRLDS